MLFEDNNSTNMLSFSDEADQILADDEEDLYEGTHKAMALLMGLEPLATSVCSFYLSYEQDPKQKRNRQVKRSIMTLQAMVDSMEKNREELLMDAAYDRDAYDLEDYENTKRIVEARCEGHYVASRRMLAEHEGSPEAVYYELETCEVRISDGLESEPYGQMTRRIPLGPDDIVSMDNRHLGEKAVEEGNSRSGVA